MHFKYDQNLFLLWLFLIFQILVLVGYLKFSSTWNNDPREKSEKSKQSIKFLQLANNNFGQKLGLEKYKSYYESEVDGEIHLKMEKIDNFFITINNTICFQSGTDTGYMKRNLELAKENGKCECLPGYHGNDCSLPEIIWRAFIALRKETIIRKRRKNARRIIHMFEIRHPAQIPIAAIKINELFSTVDLFLVFESNQTQFGETKPFHFKSKLDQGLCSGKQHKILFTPIHVRRDEEKSLSQLSWEKCRRIVKNLREDDLFLLMDGSEIPNPKALLFFKLYDGFSLPIQFRLKWNVYGYYYQHLNKTKRRTAGSTVGMLEQSFMGDPDSIESYDGGTGLTVGDLNHYGGWFCDLCYDPKEMLDVVQTFHEFEEILSTVTKVVDRKYLEQLIGDGFYVDGKTPLVRNHEGTDDYYSPEFVANHYWKFDSLLINFYNKVDYN